MSSRSQPLVAAWQRPYNPFKNRTSATMLLPNAAVKASQLKARMAGRFCSRGGKRRVIESPAIVIPLHGAPLGHWPPMSGVVPYMIAVAAKPKTPVNRRKRRVDGSIAPLSPRMSQPSLQRLSRSKFRPRRNDTLEMHSLQALSL
jgi:hypothetical protein